MYKKKIAMDQSNGNNDDSVVSAVSAVSNPLAEALEETAPVENGNVRLPRAGKKRKTTGIIKVVRKKIKKPKKVSEVAKVVEEAPGADSDGEYEVEAIVDHKKEKGKTLYRVKWKGYSSAQDSWLPSAELSCKDILKKYKNKMKRETKDVYTVSKILDHRRLKGTIYYRVRWENYGSKDDTWQPKESLSCNDLLKQYHDELNTSILKREEAKLEAKLKAKKSNGEYEVESIIDSKLVKGCTKYRIRWKGWDESDDTWQFEDELNCPDLIRAFTKKNGKSPQKKAKSKGKKRKHNSDSEDDDSADSDYGTGQKAKGGQYEVERVLNARINKSNKWDFYVMWKGYGPESNTWEPEDNLNCHKLITQFLGKDKVPRTVQAKLEQKVATEAAVTKPKRKPPSERGTPGSGLRGRTKGEMKVLKFSI